MEERESEKSVETKKKEAYDWRYENSIMNGPKVEIDGDYSQWRINNILSKHKDIVPFINEMNINYQVSNHMHYSYLHGAVRKYRRQYTKGETKQEKAAREKEQELISLISEHYKYNIVRAKEVLKILTAEQINEIRKRKEKGGVK
jgi:aspartokinase